MSFKILTLSVYRFIITMLKYRNYDSTASLDAFCVEEGINSLNIDDGQGIEDISSIIDTGEKTLNTSLISVSEIFDGDMLH